MKYVYLFIIAILVITPLSAQTENTENTTTYYFIRHAEKDRRDQSNKNPHLTEVGKMRAKHWSEVFSNITFDAIYSTDYNRTRETAEPTATINQLELSIYSPRDFNLEEFLEDTKGKTVLIVGHSNTTPTLVNAVLGQKKYDHIDDSNNGNLYIVTIIDGKVSEQVLVIN